MRDAWHGIPTKCRAYRMKLLKFQQARIPCSKYRSSRWSNWFQAYPWQKQSSKHQRHRNAWPSSHRSAAWIPLTYQTICHSWLRKEKTLPQGDTSRALNLLMDAPSIWQPRPQRSGDWFRALRNVWRRVFRTIHRERCTKSSLPASFGEMQYRKPRQNKHRATFP